jgi:hypothetical protein
MGESRLDVSDVPSKRGEIVNRARYLLRLSSSIKQPAQRLVKEDGRSLNEWIAAAVVEKVAVIETAAEFFKSALATRRVNRLMKFLRNAPDDDPEPGG